MGGDGKAKTLDETSKAKEGNEDRQQWKGHGLLDDLND